MVNSHSDSHLGLSMHAMKNTWLEKTKAVCHSLKAGSLLTLPWKLLHSVMGGSSQSSKLSLLGPSKWAVCVVYISGTYISISPTVMALADAPNSCSCLGLITFTIVLPFSSLPPPQACSPHSLPPMPSSSFVTHP